MDKVITIKIQGGCVVDVENMPKGYKYIIEDEDITEEQEDDQIYWC